MADYYPLIARAVAGLDKNTGENRRALYERARGALVNQLRGVEPALDESEITRERLALEEAIRRLEAEAARRVRPEPPQELPGSEASDGRPSLHDRGLRDFRDTVAEAEGLGGATADASRSARAAYDDAQEGGLHAGAGADDEPDTGHEAGEHYFEPAEAGQAEARNADRAPARDARHMGDEDLPSELPEPDLQGSWQHPPPPPPGAHDEVYSRPPRSYGRIIKMALLLLAFTVVLAGGYWQRGAIMSAVNTVTASLKSSPPPPVAQPKPASEPGVRPKIADRVGSPDNATAKSASAPAAAVAQKVVLYDEDSADPKGKRYVGSAVWRTETVSPGPGLAPELAIRADVEIPERRMRMTWSLRRNTDKALPASHTIEIMFTLPADFAEGGIANVPGVLMKQNEGARGVPLAGLAVKVTNGYFLIGLSAVAVDLQRNIQLLKERDWFDIPIVYTSGKRAILAIEKGTPGGRAFEEAFRAWGQ